MTLNQLRVFLAAARLGSFTAAAESLEMAQPSVSELVKRLEETYGTRLFVRGGRRLILTSAGRELLPLAEQTVASAAAADRALRAVNALTGGVASFGLLRNANYYSLSNLLTQFHAAHPSVRLRVLGVNSVEVAHMVQVGELEAGLVVLPVDTTELKVLPLRRDEVLYASANPDHVKSPVTLADLAARNLILYDAHYGWRDPTRRQLADRAQIEGITLEARIEVEQTSSALNLVAAGAGDTFVSKTIVDSGTCPPEIFYTSFADPFFETVALVQREDTVLSPATAELARLAQLMLSDSANL
ncbi:LysR family transcriptional regulator [Cryobacterium luteum]|uniref:LysR family transcriptional regulator n=1 Tax=Cryobacterium luteum TaxID=1424661 RepID=A0A1H8A598_9MICO|nr:LysR family transcriptional regulator [Cryobacterium luteum]TFB88366.1 LysR family transcriptional regulator [Cryobacterium luteum]SEM65094.1 DNA-binding transcriptional regulator, LysR family [Cryobacterium luteum]